MRSHLIAVLLCVPALGACTGASADEESTAPADQVDAAWRADVEEALGSDAFDLGALQGQAATDCGRASVAAWVPTLVMSGELTSSTTALTRIGLEHACPDVVEAFDAALGTVESAADPLELVCGPDAVLEGEDAAKAELVCASR